MHLHSIAPVVVGAINAVVVKGAHGRASCLRDAGALVHPVNRPVPGARCEVARGNLHIGEEVVDHSGHKSWNLFKKRLGRTHIFVIV